MLIYKFSTYHKSAAWALPLLVVFGIFVAYVFVQLGLRAILEYVILMVFFLAGNYQNNKKKSTQILDQVKEIDAYKFMSESLNKTSKYYILSSVLYCTTFLIMSVYFYNQSPNH